MAISEKDVQYIAHLARIAILDTELNRYTYDMANILKLAEEMNALATENIEPMAHPLQISQRLRPDTITETNQRELFLKIAPQVEAGLYLVPQVIE